jgi:ubiquinone biosynthesis protein COQ4
MLPSYPIDWSAEQIEQLLASYPRRRVRLVMALHAMVRLTFDPQDTRQVALLEIALGGVSPKGTFARFLSTSTGRSVLERRFSLTRMLDDHEHLRTLPPNSLGRRYLEFMEAEGLSAQGLMDATPAYTAYLADMHEAVRIFSDHTQRGSHDLYHVLFGYGRDELGETCVVGLAYEQIGIRGYKVIATVGPYVVRRHLRRAGVATSSVFAAVREAIKTGRSASWLPGLDMEAALGEDIDSLRVRLGVRPPAHYLKVLDGARQVARWTQGPFAALAKRDLAKAA